MSKTRREKTYLVPIICLLLILAGCGGRFSRTEKGIINGTDNGPMRVLTTENTEDSLFLRRTAEPVKRSDTKSQYFKTLQERMLETVNDPANEGVGIAAPQVGISRRLIAVQRFDKPGEPFEFYINPEIICYSDTTGEGREGCLSVPDYAGQVIRSREIEVCYLNEEFRPVTETISGYTAVIFQHETDHLDGILYTDKAKTLYKRTD